ncbi:class I SAM-dependent methyltransferase [Mesorhizobium caraganae]|uniref:class I SAM-dependent methyltransferase n=1 Tax=Mesorhizobium caraganae TaxID=483206 RepID=UPI001939C828|nr:class I SAM-dependent methyltransferase [Mesorhizobium caraganae]MBM2712647.1 class I SAM-dependent methyltransferase [Mesorhizobium caraganae]
MAGKRLAGHLHGRRSRLDTKHFDFGWAPARALGPWIAAVAVQVATPAYWPLAMMLRLLAANFFAGGLIARAVGRYEHAVLPMVDLLSGDTDVVLDAGCGAGLTTIALGRAFRRERIVALDRFDPDYIEGGGRALLEQNLRLAGLTGRVDIELGDLTALPFPEGRFDAAVSAHRSARPAKGTGLREIFRVLNPGGRFLLIVWVPGWTMFAIVSVLALLFSGKRAWRRMATSAGFESCGEGMLNGN